MVQIQSKFISKQQPALCCGMRPSVPCVSAALSIVTLAFSATLHGLVCQLDPRPQYLASGTRSSGLTERAKLEQRSSANIVRPARCSVLKKQLQDWGEPCTADCAESRQTGIGGPRWPAGANGSPRPLRFLKRWLGTGVRPFHRMDGTQLLTTLQLPADTAHLRSLSRSPTVHLPTFMWTAFSGQASQLCTPPLHGRECCWNCKPPDVSSSRRRTTRPPLADSDIASSILLCHVAKG